MPLFMAQFIKFGLVGTLGFLVDTAVLYGCMEVGTGPYGGRAISFVVAASVTWFCNRHFTFKDRKGRESARKQWAKFFVVAMGGFCFNYGTYAVLIAWVPLVAIYPVLGVAAGSIAGLFFNFFASKRVVFR